jgi:hypothetical protein
MKIVFGVPLAKSVRAKKMQIRIAEKKNNLSAFGIAKFFDAS